jgi:hypothetical protein
MAKIGSEHLGAMGRQGLRELRGAIYPSSNIAQQAEYGIYGTRTPGEVAESRRGDGISMEDEKPAGTVLDDRMKAVEARSRDAASREQVMER